MTPYDAGRAAHADGRDLLHCPHPMMAPEWGEWVAGWCDAEGWT